MKSKIMRYPDELLVQWAADFYDRVYGDEQAPQEAEIKNANIDVPEQDVAKAQETLRRKFDYVYGKMKESVDNDIANQQTIENKSHDEGFLKGAVTGAAAVTPAAALLASAVAAQVSPSTFFVVGFGAVALTCFTALGLGIAGSSRRNKKMKQALDLGLSTTEFDCVRKHEKEILKFTKIHGHLPTPENEEYGEVANDGNGMYNLYLYMKMLQHKGLMEDKMSNDKAASKEEE